MNYSSVALSNLVVAEDNEIDALLLLIDAPAKDKEVAEALYREAKACTDAARAAWESFLPQSIRR